MDLYRVVTARQLASDLMRAAALAAALADEAVWELTRSRGSARDVAAALGVSEAAVRKAIQQHNRRAKKALTEGADSDMANQGRRGV